MDKNERIDKIKDKILDRINITLDNMSSSDVHKSEVIKNLVISYDYLSRIKIYE